MLSFNPVEGAVLDHMGVPVSHSEAIELLVILTAHLQKSPEELCEIAMDRCRSAHPRHDANGEFTPSQFK